MNRADEPLASKNLIVSTTSTSLSAADLHEEEEDASTQRWRLAAAWLAAGSAVALMVVGSWLQVVQIGGPPGGDMVGHAATAEWLRTLPWWGWRGWSDWFYGGQAIGINYPPLSLNWTRFTHPVHGQMAAVAVGLLVLLPWGTLRLASAVGYPPRLQRIAVGAVLALTAGSGFMHWPLSGFHAIPTFFGSWPAMMAVVTGLFTAAWAARCHRPVAAGIVTGIALLWNATVIPGLGAVCLALLATSGASFRQATRWAVTAGTAALAVSGWWLVPFVASWDRLVRWEVPLHRAWEGVGSYQNLILAGLGFVAVWAARRPGPARRLGGAALVGVVAVLLAEWTGWLRPERWLSFAVITAAIACAGIAHQGTGPIQRDDDLQPGWFRPVWRWHAALGLVVFAVLTLRIEFLAPAFGLILIPSRRTWAWMGVLAWAASLYWGGLWGLISPESERSANPLSEVTSQNGSSAKGLVGLDRNLTLTSGGDFQICLWYQSWLTTSATDGGIRPLAGLYRETSPSAEFIEMERIFYTGDTAKYYPERPDWFEVWESNGMPAWSTPAAAEALGGRWYVSCDENGEFSVIDLAGVTASGVTVALFPSEDSWHRAAAQWWIPISAGFQTEPESWEPVPVRSEISDPRRPAGQAAGGVWLHSDGDRLTVGADSPGWAWLRVPWDPYWSAPPGAAVHKGGPGHLVVWVPEGETVLVWRVPGAVDAAAAAVTGAAGLLVLIMAATNRRQDQQRDPGRPRPVRAAVSLYADTVDEWLRTAARRTRRQPNTNRHQARSGTLAGPR